MEVRKHMLEVSRVKSRDSDKSRTLVKGTSDFEKMQFARHTRPGGFPPEELKTKDARDRWEMKKQRKYEEKPPKAAGLWHAKWSEFLLSDNKWTQMLFPEDFLEKELTDKLVLAANEMLGEHVA